MTGLSYGAAIQWTKAVDPYNSNVVIRRIENQSTRSPAYAMRALGRSDVPREFQLAGKRWRHVRTMKHDFFAATALYEDDADSPRRVVLKISRTADFAGVPLEWLGRWLCRREIRFYSRLSDLPNVPAVLGTVGRTGFVHAYVEGRPLSGDKPLPAGFFEQLEALIEKVHKRDIAYVDTNKPENILLGDDGRPYLIDFQISWDLNLGRTRLNRWILRRLQAEDLYHLAKHRRRLRQEEPAKPADEIDLKLSPWIRAHRLIATPFKRFRRRTMERMRISGRLLPEGSK
jgi:hypothetical protein